jgi:mannose-6-phosphate isomerase-like protein (cupin superfamily)
MKNAQLVECGRLKLVAADERREIHELAFSPPGGRVQFFWIMGRGPLGQHFHKRTEEVFSIMNGRGVIFVVPVDDNGKMIGSVSRFDVNRGCVIRIPQFHAHRFDMVEGTEMLAFSSLPFDQADLFPCPIEVP